MQTIQSPIGFFGGDAMENTAEGPTGRFAAALLGPATQP